MATTDRIIFLFQCELSSPNIVTRNDQRKKNYETNDQAYGVTSRQSVFKDARLSSSGRLLGNANGIVRAKPSDRVQRLRPDFDSGEDLLDLVDA